MRDAIVELLINDRLDAPSFTVDILQESVPLVYPSADAGRMSDAGSHTGFAVGDNFTILSLGCYLPMGFEFLIKAPEFFQTNMLDMKLGEVGTQDRWFIRRLRHFWVVAGSYEMGVGMYINVNTEVPEVVLKGFNLHMRFNEDQSGDLPRIDMRNVPEDKHGKGFTCPVFCKIAHNFALVSEPAP
jgi:hypothetical protein